MQDQKFKPFDPFEQKQEADGFEFKPLDLSSITGQPKKRRARMPCEVCFGRDPNCPIGGSREVEVDDESKGAAR